MTPYQLPVKRQTLQRGTAPGAQGGPTPRIFFFSSRRRHTRFDCDWSSDVCSSDLNMMQKDMLLALELGRQLDVPMPTTAVTNEFLTAARGMGVADKDFAVVFAVLAKRSGERRVGEEGRSRGWPDH